MSFIMVNKTPTKLRKQSRKCGHHFADRYDRRAWSTFTGRNRFHHCQIWRQAGQACTDADIPVLVIPSIMDFP